MCTSVSALLLLCAADYIYLIFICEFLYYKQRAICAAGVVIAMITKTKQMYLLQS